jgi:hypothetical protein
MSIDPHRFEGRLRDLAIQTLAAERIGLDLRAYAQRIGCTIFQDEIICHTDEQSKLISQWWMEHAHG